MAIMEFHCELWHVSSTDEVTAQIVTEFEPDSVIYNIEEYNRTYIGVLTIDECCLFEVFWSTDGLSSKEMKDLHDNHVLNTPFMKSDWLKMKYPDVGMKCKQGHAVNCSVDHQKCLVNHHSKQTHMGTHTACMLIWSCDQNTLYKSP